MGIGAVSTVIIDAHRHFRYRSADVGVRARPARRAERDEPRPPGARPTPRARPAHTTARPSSACATAHRPRDGQHSAHWSRRGARHADGHGHGPHAHAGPRDAHRRGSPYGFARAQAACVSESNLKVLQVLSVLLRASYAAIRPPRGIKDAWAQPPLCLLPRPDIRHALCSRRGLLCWMLGARLV